MLNFLDQMVVDDKREMVLKHINKRKGTQVVIQSDHNILISEFSINYKISKSKLRREYFNFKSNEDKVKFFNEGSLLI